MKTINFNFEEIQNLRNFYKEFREKFNLPSNVCNNMDGLWDAITGMIELPAKIEFNNLSLEQLDKFQNIISLFEEAEEETENQLEFSYFMSK